MEVTVSIRGTIPSFGLSVHVNHGTWCWAALWALPKLRVYRVFSY